MGEEIGHRHHKDEEKLHDAFLVVIRFLSLEEEDERAVCDGGKEEGEDGDESLVLEVREDQGIERPGVECHLRIAVHGLVEIDQQDLLESDEEIASGSKRGGKGDDDIDQRDIEKIADYVILIHQGRIVFEEEKDTLIYQYGIVRCEKKQFTDIQPEDYIISRKTNVSIECLVRDKEATRRKYKNVVVDSASLEEIMLFYIKGGLAE